MIVSILRVFLLGCVIFLTATPATMGQTSPAVPASPFPPIQIDSPPQTHLPYAPYPAAANPSAAPERHSPYIPANYNSASYNSGPHDRPYVPFQPPMAPNPPAYSDPPAWGGAPAYPAPSPVQHANQNVIEDVIQNSPDRPPPVDPSQPAGDANAPKDDATEAVFPSSHTWYEIRYWFPENLWESSFELGINGAQGNSQSFNLRVGTNLKRENKKSVMKFDFVHSQTNTDSVATQNYYQLDNRLEWLFHEESRWSWFFANQLLHDEFTAFDLRLVVNTGVGYRVIKQKTVTLKGRFGSGASREFGGPDENWAPEALFGADYEHKVSKRQSFNATLDYFPEWTNFSDFRLVADASWVIVLDEETNLSLKLSAIDRYDSTPNGQRPNDINYALLLLWKL